MLTGVILSLTMNQNWVFLSAFFGAGLVFAGSTGWCGLPFSFPKCRGIGSQVCLLAKVKVVRLVNL